MSTYLDRVKKKVKSLKIENFDQTSEKLTPPSFDQTRRCPLFKGLTVSYFELLYYQLLSISLKYFKIRFLLRFCVQASGFFHS